MICPHFKKCGGCSWLDAPYEEQLSIKKAKLEECLRVLPSCEVAEIIPAEEQYYYRNKMEFTFGGDAEELYLGQHYKDSFYRIENLSRCVLFDERIGVILDAVRDFARSNKLVPYNPKTHEGFLRHLKVRTSKTGGGMMVILVTAGKFDDGQGFAALFDEFPFVKSVYYGINSRVSDIADCEEIFFLKGEEYLKETLGGVSFLISSESFFQPNTVMSRKMYDCAKDIMKLKGGEYILDLYSGSGGIGLYVAKDVQYLYAVEMQGSSVSVFRRNLEENKIVNAEIIQGDVKKVLPLVKRDGFDFAFIDPPRSGMSRKAVKKAISKHPENILFFSCKIETSVMNLLEFEKYGFRIKKAVPFDMFPQTPFMETVFLLGR